MILTDIQQKIKDIPDVSPRIFAVLALFLLSAGVFFAESVISREYAREGSLRVISGSAAAASQDAAHHQGEFEGEKGKFLASQSGSFYYLPTCSGAKRIKEKNVIWFQSRGAAEARGLRPAANCPGIEKEN